MDRLVAAICRQIQTQFGENPLENPDYGKIVNDKHFDRLLGLLSSGRAVIGGQSRRETRQIAPTVLTDVMPESPVMQEEIFGPILPILPFDDFREVCEFLSDRPKPLALYLFSQDRARVRDALGRLQFGGGCINDVVIHLATSEMGFGGVGESGMGAYHGQAGFAAFSHERSIVDKKTWLDLPMRYQPYRRQRYGGLLRLFLR